MDFSTISQFIKDNYIIIIAISAIIFILFSILKVRRREPQLINRAIVMKKKRIEELSKNARTLEEANENFPNLINLIEYKELFHGIRWLGSISNIGIREERENSEIFYEIVFKPPLFMNILSNPFKRDLLRIAKTNIIFDKSRGKIVINPMVSIDAHMGWYYDVPNEKKNLNWINDQIFKDDLASTNDMYYVESQKRSVIDIEHAHEEAIKEKELQIELAKRKGKQTSI